MGRWLVGQQATRVRKHGRPFACGALGWARLVARRDPAFARRSLLFAVATTGERAWVVGDRGFPARTLIERWDGERWALMPSPGGLWFTSTAAVSGGPVWAVGQTGRKPLAVHC